MIPTTNAVEHADSEVVIRSELATRTHIEIIDSERIYNAESVPKEFFCPICSCLLWQPRSCGSCQNLFCEACIRKWLQTNTKCPYGCVQYQDKRCSPQIRCLLSNIWVRCQSTGYGCTAILSYDTLEAHQTDQCEYPSDRCPYCENLMLRSEIVAHEHECGQKLGSCAKCNSLVPLFLLEQHKLSCVRVSLQQLVQNIHQLQNFTQPGYTFPPDPPQQNIANSIVNTDHYTEEERQIQKEYYNLPWYRCFWSLACLIFMNPLDAPQILLTVWQTGWGSTIGCFLVFIFIVSAFCFQNICTGFLSIILFTGLLHNGAPWFLSLVNDSSIMIFSTILFLIVGSLRIHVNAHQLRKRKPIGRSLLAWLCSIVVWKLLLLFVRFYCRWIPAYVTATFVTGISIFISLILRLVSMRSST